ncbi:hypothetical protein H4582DRAFT_1951223 [Lactarius indigo]|nr:hypothetical protein H4582DRAFT_1951223 [Lactarius indigo]
MVPNRVWELPPSKLPQSSILTRTMSRICRGIAASLATQVIRRRLWHPAARETLRPRHRRRRFLSFVLIQLPVTVVHGRHCTSCFRIYNKNQIQGGPTAHRRSLRKTLYCQLLFLSLSLLFCFPRDSETTVPHYGSFPAFISILRSHLTVTDDQDATPPSEFSSHFPTS